MYFTRRLGFRWVPSLLLITIVVLGTSAALIQNTNADMQYDFDSKQDNNASSNKGTVTINHGDSPAEPPTGIITYSLPDTIWEYSGSYPMTYNPEAGYLFVRWETSGGASVSDPNSQSTTLVLTQGQTGSVRAIYGVPTMNIEQNGSPVSSIDVPVSSEFTLEVWVRNIPQTHPLIGLDFTVTWDNTQVEYLYHTTQNHGFQYTEGPADPKAAGNLYFTAPTDPGIPVTEDDWWVRITFHCLDQGTSDITITSIDTIYLMDNGNPPIAVNPADHVVTCNQFQRAPSKPYHYVGGEVFTVNKLAVLSPYLALIGVVAVAAILAKRKLT